MLSHNNTPGRPLRRSKHTPFAGIVWIIIFSIALIAAFGLSVAFGTLNISLNTEWQAITAFNPKLPTHEVIRDIRIPRALAAVLVGAFLAVSGTIMQGLTQNPLASPSIMGVSDGAAFVLVMILAFTAHPTPLLLTLASFAGAGIGVALVFGIGTLSKTGLTPVKLTLAGVAVGTLLRSLSTTVALHTQVVKDLSFWYAGGLDGANWADLRILILAGIIGLTLAAFIAHSMTLLSLGDEVSISLGLKTNLVKLIGALVVLILSGASVSVAGTIGFVGLVVPHIARFLIGHDYRLLIPASAVLGSLLLVLSDLVSRMINSPYETPVGAITAIIGIPFFLYLARSERRSL